MRPKFNVAVLLAVAAICSMDTAVGDQVTLEEQDGRLKIAIDGEPFGTLVYEGYKKPFIIDIHGPQGTIVTRSLDDEAVTDHPHHKGLWVAIDEVNELGHWREAHRIRTQSVETLKGAGDPARFRITNEWLDDDGESVLLETSTVSVHADRLIAYEIVLTPAGDEPVEFADTKEGFFAVRVRDALREKGGSGHIVNVKGQQGEAEAWGQEAVWVDYSGQVNGKTLGVSIFDHSGNPRPGRYHARGYGLFSVNPFGQSAYTKGKLEPAPIHLKPGETLRLRYAAWFHAGNAEQANVAARFQRYVDATEKSAAPPTPTKKR